MSVTTLSTDEWPSVTKLISLEKANLKCDSSEIVDKIRKKNSSDLSKLERKQVSGFSPNLQISDFWKKKKTGADQTVKCKTKCKTHFFFKSKKVKKQIHLPTQKLKTREF